jgi:ABC-type glycerol-3-phosphate transport system substrate-binding protein
VLQQALNSPNPPDVVLVDASDLSGLDPARALLPAPVPGTPLFLPELQGTFVRDGRLWALPDEYSIDVLFYNKLCFDRAGLGYPGPHWTLDILESSSRAITLCKELDPQGRRVFALELPADFDLWNVLSAEAGQPVCDNYGWHLGDPKAAIFQKRGLEFFQMYFRDLDVIAPLTNDEQAPGDLFLQNRSALCVAPIQSRERFRQNPLLNWAVTRFPQDVHPRTNLSVRGWAISKSTRYPAEAALLAQTLCDVPIHEGWVSANINESPQSNVNDDLAGLLKPLVSTGVFYIDDPQTVSWKQSITQELQHFAQTNSDGLTVDSLFTKLVSLTKPENQHVQIQTELPKAVKKPK